MPPPAGGGRPGPTGVQPWRTTSARPCAAAHGLLRTPVARPLTRRRGADGRGL